MLISAEALWSIKTEIAGSLRLIIKLARFKVKCQNCAGCTLSTVIPAMVQRLFFDMIKQRDHKYATPPP